MKGGGYRYRAPCALGTFWHSHGASYDGKPILEPCVCGTHQPCRFCGKRHVWIARCRACGSRGLPSRAAR